MKHNVRNLPQDTACIILARGGSKGVPGKNLRKIGGVSLIGRSVRAARAASKVTAVYVSTDDVAIAREAEFYGALIIHRPEELSGDMATSEEGWLHAIEIIREDLPNLEKVVFLQCTSPFTRGDDIDCCLTQMEILEADCAISVLENHSFLWRQDNDKYGVGINHDEGEHRKRRQDLEPQYCESGAIYCVKLESFLLMRNRFCGKVALYQVDHPAIEVDTPQDLTLCSQIAQYNDHCEINSARLAGIKAIVMDFDGVHTDNSVITDQNGLESVCTSRGDGMGIAILRDSGRYHMMILSKERNDVVLKRAKKLQLDALHGIDDKVDALDFWLGDLDLNWCDLLYIGNDVNDLKAMKRAGLSACPMDAHTEVLSIADWILPKPGGRGALRALADIIQKSWSNEN